MTPTMRLSTLTLAGATAGLASVLMPPGAAAAPATDTSVAVCPHFFDSSLDRQSAGGDYWYDNPQSAAHTTTDCGTISITVLDHSNYDCSQFRIRIFPSGGGSFTRPAPSGSWSGVMCNGNTATLAADFVQGTRYRVESTKDHMSVRVRG